MGYVLAVRHFNPIIDTDNWSSFSTQRQCEKLQGVQHSTTILVFTVMTIVYLPLSFTAVSSGLSSNLLSYQAHCLQGLFALNLFQLDHPRQKTAFITTIVLVVLSTYFVSGFLIWFVRTEERRHMFMHLWNRRADGSSNIEGGPKDESFPFHTILRNVFASKQQKTSSQKANNPSTYIPHHNSDIHV
jgi:hypothetical protein